ncbi:MAG TPA: hypothetical protein VFH42_00550, partial [Sporolactobacillaceae bacterium]|nr:hypothetical protein [Sporolactobacillaceae bacterium]
AKIENGECSTRIPPIYNDNAYNSNLLRRLVFVLTSLIDSNTRCAKEAGASFIEWHLMLINPGCNFAVFNKAKRAFSNIMVQKQ